MAKALGTHASQPQDALAYFGRHGRFGGGAQAGQMRDAGQMAWILGAIWNRLELGQAQEAHAMCGLGLAALDQLAISGNVDIGYLWCHLPEPPFNTMQRSGNTAQELRPFSQLAHP